MATTKKTLLILAAGMGSRYGGLKQIDPVGLNGETIIDYSVYDAIRAGFDRLVFVIRRDIEAAFRENVGARFERVMAVDYVFQDLDRLPAGFTPPPARTKPWGTGHAILSASDAIATPFAVINADDFYGAASFQKVAAHLNSASPDFAMIGFTLRNTLSDFGTVARGLCQLVDGHLATVREIVGIQRDGNAARYNNGDGTSHSLTGGEIVSMNMWGFDPSIFEPLQRQWLVFLGEHGSDEKVEFYIPTVVNELIRGGQRRVRVLPTPSAWFGVTYREDRPFVAQGIRRLIQSGEYPEKLWK